MTAKEALRDLVDDLSEDKAAEVLEWLKAEVNEESWRISDEERAAVERGLADARAGRVVPLAAVEQELELR